MIRSAFARFALPGPIALPVLALLSLLVFLPGFFSLPAMDRDESRFAQASKQMVENGDFLDIRFQETPRHKKPIGIYWLQAASALVFDTSDAPQIWAYRVPSLVGAIVSVLLTWGLGRVLFGRRVALLAALFLMGSVLLGFEARQAKTDAVLLACILGAQLCLAMAYTARSQDAPIGRKTAYCFWLLLGIGILIKGPIILLITGVTIVGLIAVERRVDWVFALKPLSGMGLTCLIIAPWFIAIGIATGGAFFQEAVGQDLAGKILSGQESHGAPPGYYLLTVWLTFWPFGLFAGLGLLWGIRNFSTPGARFALAWLIPNWILFELIATKLPHYVLPLYPALAVLCAVALVQEMPRDRLFRICKVLGLGMTALITVALMVAAGAVLVLYGDPLSFWLVPAILAGTAMLGLLWRQFHDGAQLDLGILPLFLAGICLIGSIFQGVLPAAQDFWISESVADVVSQHRQTCPNAPFAIVGYSEPSLVFLAGTETYFTSVEGAAVSYLADPTCALVAIPEAAVPDFQQRVEVSGVMASSIAHIQGFNYNGGKRVGLIMFSGTE
ncbi:MAG TPA: glycosyl transferase [Rhodospirillaceae bacterium]|nr:glycosyl transferase [Rhodospirillaceae bacterium]MAX64338.1 glycosyl transferase [Rhodospirillaceae bacterium]MBB58253.1 glycosyl transferase [Rhodospirillaceae bacterium]HBM12342.1 glycosyl transferase [Rhodospirillaceae bacterium]|tara:strand:- start:33118 stop:34788 length:1671 start_codon:yes stop_codon:yes gene_type:complete